VREALRTPPKPTQARRAGDIWGYLPGADKAMQPASEFYPGAIRMELPYRDLRLLRLFAGFPADFLEHKGLDRAPARHMLVGHVPDHIRLRTVGMPASPDHYARIQRQAPMARARIALFRKSAIDEWLDLEWLDGALAHVGEKGTTNATEANQVQLTAIAAEFLLWWRERS